jgi:hypothetical protein
MLTGKMAFEAQTPMASLLKRSQEGFAPVSAVDNSIPREGQQHRKPVVWNLRRRIDIKA